MGKNPDPGSGMNTSDLIFEILISVFALQKLKFFDANRDPGFGILSTPDPDPRSPSDKGLSG